MISMQGMTLDASRTKHNILPVTGRCYNCGVRLRYTGKGAKDRKYYCSLPCMRQRPPKMVLAELYWGEPFESLALRHLNNGGSVQALADMCGVHKQAVLQWLRVRGIERRVMWRKRGDVDAPSNAS